MISVNFLLVNSIFLLKLSKDVSKLLGYKALFKSSLLPLNSLLNSFISFLIFSNSSILLAYSIAISKDLCLLLNSCVILKSDCAMSEEVKKRKSPNVK